MKIFMYAIDETGHFNALIGLAQTLAKRGHKIYFVEPEKLAGKFKRFGFEEILLTYENASVNYTETDPIRDWAEFLKREGHFSEKAAKDKLAMFEPICEVLFQKALQFQPQMEAALCREKPDLIIVDQMFQLPAVVFSGIPWIRNWSTNPLMIYESEELPPPCVGLPIDDCTHWEEYRKLYQKGIQDETIKWQNRLFAHFNYPESDHKSFQFPSPFLNVHAFPEELDYLDHVSLPPKHFRIDAYSRSIAQPFEFPEEFKRKIQPGDKVIYFSMGSMGSINVDLMKRLIKVLGNTPYWFVVSRGPRFQEYELAENMWGEPWVPQTNILPLVDLVITHGGNNTLTESICAGKPMIVMPLFVDQYDNAQRVHEKGFGTRFDPYRVNSDELVKAVDRFLADQELKLRLEKASQRIEQSQSKEKLCDQLEEIVQTHQRKQRSNQN